MPKETVMYCNLCGCDRTHDEIDSSPPKSNKVLVKTIRSLVNRILPGQWYACQYCGEVHERERRKGRRKRKEKDRDIYISLEEENLYVLPHLDSIESR